MFEDWILGFSKFGDVSAWLEVYAGSSNTGFDTLWHRQENGLCLMALETTERFWFLWSVILLTHQTNGPSGLTLAPAT